MQINELVEELAKLYPGFFKTQAGIDAWAVQYRQVLKNFQGPPLAIGFARCMETWDKLTFPKPADIRRCIPESSAAARGEGKIINRREQFDYAGRRVPELTAEAFRDLEARAGKLVPAALKRCLESHIRNRLQLLAQVEYLHDKGFRSEQEWNACPWRNWKITGKEIRACMALLDRASLTGPRAFGGFAQRAAGSAPATGEAV